MERYKEIWTWTSDVKIRRVKGKRRGIKRRKQNCREQEGNEVMKNVKNKRWVELGKDKMEVRLPDKKKRGDVEKMGERGHKNEERQTWRRGR